MKELAIYYFMKYFMKVAADLIVKWVERRIAARQRSLELSRENKTPLKYQNDEQPPHFRLIKAFSFSLKINRQLSDTAAL
jgi:hypothetical protein